MRRRRDETPPSMQYEGRTQLQEPSSAYHLPGERSGCRQLPGLLGGCPNHKRKKHGMDNQRRKIAGCRELNQVEIDAIDEIKAHGAAKLDLWCAAAQQQDAVLGKISAWVTMPAWRQDP